MMECTLFDAEFGSFETGELDLIERWKSSPDSVMWLSITGEITEELEELLEEPFGIHPLAIQDAKRNRHPPKLEVFEENTFLLFKTLKLETTDIHCSTIQFAMFVGDRFLITRTSDRSRAIERLKGEVKSCPETFNEGRQGQMAARLIRLFVDRFLETLLTLEPLLEEYESQLLERAGDEMIAKLTGYKSDLKQLRRIFLYHEQVLNQLRQLKAPGFTDVHRHWLNDVYEQQERANSLTLLYYELASDLIDGCLSLASHRLNGIMKILTIVTAVFVPLGFLAGIYGMNFENMPELNSRWGYFILLGAMATIATGLLWVFRRKKWL